MESDVMNVTKVYNVSRSPAEENELESTVTLGMAAVICALAAGIVASSSLALRREVRRSERRYDTIYRVFGRLAAGGLLMPSAAVTILHHSFRFLDIPSCYVLLGMQLFALFGRNLCGYASVGFVRINILRPLQSKSILSRNCAMLAFVVLWGVDLVLFIVPTVLFVLKAEKTPGQIYPKVCSWRAMYPPSFILSAIYAISLAGDALILLTIFQVSSVVRRHRQMIGVQRGEVACQLTLPQRVAIFCTKHRTKFRYIPAVATMAVGTSLILVNLHCEDCLHEPLGTFLQWLFWGGSVLLISITMYVDRSK